MPGRQRRVTPCLPPLPPGQWKAGGDMSERLIRAIDRAVENLPAAFLGQIEAENPEPGGLLALVVPAKASWNCEKDERELGE